MLASSKGTVGFLGEFGGGLSKRKKRRNMEWEPRGGRKKKNKPAASLDQAFNGAGKRGGGRGERERESVCVRWHHRS